MNNGSSTLGRQMLNKVPEVTLYFWLIKVLSTTVGETFADFLSTTLKLGEVITAIIMGIVLLISLFFQFRLKKYVPGVYWLSVVLISIEGTLITDNLTDNLGVSLETTTVIFGIALIATFAVWFASERTLSIHSIFTTKREFFYWLTILFTFALGTAAGDLTSEKLNLGYLNAVLIFAGLILIVVIAHFGLKLNAVLSFWLAYIFTRPLGASIGDFLSQSRKDGALGLGTVGTSFLFLAAILILVIYLSKSKVDVKPISDSGNLVVKKA
jgi:uncharacterized membrane-anchored protein